MDRGEQGLLKTEPVAEEGEDAVTMLSAPEALTATNAYKKTSETLSQAGQKASAAFSSVGSVITKKLEDVKNSPTFKSFEEKVENLKSKVGGAKPAGGDFGEVLNSTANATSTMTTEPPPEQMTESP